MPVLCVGTCFLTNSTIDSQTQAENQTCFRRSAFKIELSLSRSNECRAIMDWGVAFVTARAGVYAMMGSLPDGR